MSDFNVINIHHGRKVVRVTRRGTPGHECLIEIRSDQGMLRNSESLPVDLARSLGHALYDLFDYNNANALTRPQAIEILRLESGADVAQELAIYFNIDDEELE